MSQCTCTKDKEMNCIVHPTERSLKERIAELTVSLAAQVNYSIALQRAIEYHANGARVPQHIAANCPHHSELLNAALLREE